VLQPFHTWQENAAREASYESNGSVPNACGSGVPIYDIGGSGRGKIPHRLKPCSG